MVSSHKLPLRVVDFQQTLFILYAGALLLLLVQFGYIVWAEPSALLRGDVLGPLALYSIFLFLFVLMDIYTRRKQYLSPRMSWFLLGLRVVLVELYGLSQISPTASLGLYLLIPFAVYPYLTKRTCYVLLVFIGLRASTAFLIEFNASMPNIRSVDYLDFTTEGVGYLMIVALIGALIEAVDRQKRERQHSERLLDELQTLHHQIIDLAAAEERNRLARDIHDSLGHYLTVINVQLEKALTLQEKAPAVSTQAIHDAKRFSREALQDVRASVASLRVSQPTLSLEERVRRLMRDAEADDFTLELAISGSQVSYSEHTLMTLYRVTQEAITNIRKHAGARHAFIRIAFTPLQVTLEIEDDGQGFNTQQASAGLGLVGVRERIQLLGGTLIISSQPNSGTRWYVVIPVNPIQVHRLKWESV